MQTVIIQDPELALPDEALQYLKLNSKPFAIYPNSGADIIIYREYNNGVRHFILNIISVEIIALLPVILSLSDAKFVATASTLISLRGAAPNLYFTLASDKYIDLVANNLRGFIPTICVVYDNITDPYVKGVVDIFIAHGYPTFEVSDFTWQNYANLLVVTVPFDSSIWQTITDNLLPPPHIYTIYSISVTPSLVVTKPTNVSNVSIIYPNPTVIPQLNSYWNIACKDPNWDMLPPWFGIYPLLTNQKWDESILISPTFQINGFYYNRLLSSAPIHPRFNLQNPNVLHKPTGYIWLISDKYVTKYTKANLKYLKQTNPLICRIRTTSDLQCAVKKYWCQGYRQFVLQASSDQIERVQKLNLKGGVFVCTRSTSPTVRSPGSPYIFGLTDDNTMIDEKLVSIWKISGFKSIVIIGTSDNVNIPNFRAHLDELGIPWLDVNNLSKLPPNVIYVLSVGDLGDYQYVLDYIIANKSKYPYINRIVNYGEYITEDQYKLMNQIFPSEGIPVVNNYNSSQPFLESEYSEISRPLYFIDEVVFYDLSNILLKYPLDFLFAFGYLIDV